MSEAMDVEEEEDDMNNRRDPVGLDYPVIQTISSNNGTFLTVQQSESEIASVSTSRLEGDQNIQRDNSESPVGSVDVSRYPDGRVVDTNEVLPSVDDIDSDSAPNTLSQQSSASTILTTIEHSDSCTSPAKRKYLSDSVEDDESQTCPICFDNWTTSGDHRLCALKCGHLFGYSCVKRWLNAETKKSCPTCKKKVCWNDIRYIYARRVIAMDTTELTIAREKLEKVNEDKNKIQTELAKASCRIHMLTEEVEEYKKKLEAMAYVRQTHYKPQSTAEIVNLFKEKTLDLGKNSCCRVLDSKVALDVIGVSIKSSNTLYPGFGIKLLNITTFKPTAFIPVHSETVRDMKFHDAKPWLLSCSIDKKAKLIDINANRISTTFEGGSPLWSCAWDENCSHNLYLGQQQGSVLKFDIRNPSEPIHTISVQGDFSPVVSLHSMKSSNLFPFGGVISCKLNSIWAFENTRQDPLRYPLPVEGPFVSMTCHKENDHIFLSSRPNSRFPYARHSFCRLYKLEDNIMCNIVHTFRGGSTQRMLSRTCLLSNKSDYAAAYVEDQHIVSLWNINNGNKVGSVPAQESVLDLNSIKTAQADFLLTLAESKLRVFKFS